IFRIGIDQAANRAVLVSDFGLYAAPASAIARDDYFALHVNAHLLKLVVVGGHAVVDVYKLARYIAIARISVESRKLVFVAGIFVFSDDRLFELSLVYGRPNHFQHALFRRGKQNIK